MYRYVHSLTKELDLNSLREALLNYTLSIKNSDKLILMIDNLDQNNDSDNKIKELLEIISLFRIEFNDLRYQTDNLKFQQQLATKLLMDKNAFSCFCKTDSQPYSGSCEKLSDVDVLDKEEPFCIRIKKPTNDINCHDLLQGSISFSKDSIDSFVILNVDKSPRIDYAIAIDDMLNDISQIAKSQKDISDTPKQILIRDYLGYDKKIDYLHIPDIIGGDISVKNLLKEGFLPSAITNYLFLLTNKTLTKIFDLNTAIELFDLNSIKQSLQTFNLEELKELNKDHIKQTPPLELAKYLGYSSLDLGELAKIYAEVDSTINEIKSKIDKIFSIKKPDKYVNEFNILVKVAKDAPFYSTYDEFESYLLRKSGINVEQFFKPLRYMLTGYWDGIDLDKIYPYIKNYLGEIIK